MTTAQEQEGWARALLPALHPGPPGRQPGPYCRPGWRKGHKAGRKGGTSTPSPISTSCTGRDNVTLGPLPTLGLQQEQGGGWGSGVLEAWPSCL